MRVLVCIKRVPETGARITLRPDARALDTSLLGFTISPHEECAVEEALRLVEAHGGSTTVLTLGPDAAVEQLQNAMAMGIESAILLETDGDEWSAEATASSIVDAVRAQGEPFDLMLFGNEAADSGDYQVGVRVAHELGLPCVTGIKGIEVADGRLTARREAGGGWEIFEVALPTVVTVKEGINLPRYPSLPGRLRAKKTQIERLTPEPRGSGLELIRLVVPVEDETEVEVLGTGADAAPRVVTVLRELGLVAS
ncbi:MAG TPA: electron transfer flavoprotein subunit beta/FixA family protein [Gaiellaceae bacterium]|nr:electron transfer flavoprotein subunit beta/FixA family protein [Gaiellaceae bacterium]